MSNSTECFIALTAALLKKDVRFIPPSTWGSISYGSKSFPTFAREGAAIAISGNAVPYFRKDKNRVFETIDGVEDTLVFVTACAVLSKFGDARELVEDLLAAADEIGIVLVCEGTCIPDLKGPEWYSNDKKLRDVLVELGFEATEKGSPVYQRQPKTAA